MDGVDQIALWIQLDYGQVLELRSLPLDVTSAGLRSDCNTLAEYHEAYGGIGRMAPHATLLTDFLRLKLQSCPRTTTDAGANETKTKAAARQIH